jgi:hypothetical protein
MDEHVACVVLEDVALARGGAAAFQDAVGHHPSYNVGERKLVTDALVGSAR